MKISREQRQILERAIAIAFDEDVDVRYDKKIDRWLVQWFSFGGVSAGEAIDFATKMAKAGGLAVFLNCTAEVDETIDNPDYLKSVGVDTEKEFDVFLRDIADLIRNGYTHEAIGLLVYGR